MNATNESLQLLSEIKAEATNAAIDGFITIGEQADRMLELGRDCPPEQVESYAQSLQVFLEVIAKLGRKVAEKNEVIRDSMLYRLRFEDSGNLGPWLLTKEEADSRVAAFASDDVEVAIIPAV